MSLKKLSLICSTLVLLLNSPLLASGIAHLSDTTKIMLALDHMRRSIREGNPDKFVQAVSPQVCLGDEDIDRDQLRCLTDSVLSTGHSRQVVVSKPVQLPFGDFWDFGLEDISLAFTGDTCVVTCELKLYAAPRQMGEIESQGETFVFVRRGNLWYLSECHSLFQFLANGGNTWKGPYRYPLY